MDFGDILDDWERMKREKPRPEAQPRRGKKLGPDRVEAPPPVPAAEPAKAAAREAASREAEQKAQRRAFESWLDSHAVSDKDSGSSRESRNAQSEREERDRRLADLVTQASIDLHGMGASDAEAALLAFFADCARKGLEKVLVVHGKGNHSKDGPVLGQVARRAIEKSPWAGRWGPADRGEGGSGAIWVAIRRMAGAAGPRGG